MSERLRIRQVLVVEGKYDAAALAGVVDGLILTTDGFGIYKDKETQALLKELGRARGVILLTDPDAAGFRIRNYVANLVGQEHVRQAYVPAVPGKESRKEQPGREGLLGVEGLPAATLRKAVLDAGAEPAAPRAGRPARGAAHHLCRSVCMGALGHGGQPAGALCPAAQARPAAAALKTRFVPGAEQPAHLGRN